MIQLNHFRSWIIKIQNNVINKFQTLMNNESSNNQSINRPTIRESLKHSDTIKTIDIETIYKLNDRQFYEPSL